MSQIVSRQEATRNVRSLLEKMKPQIELALPRHMTPDKMMRIAMSAIQNTPKLLECTQVSLAAAIIEASQLGLEFQMGEAYLVPYGKKCQLIPGYKGLMKLARQASGITKFVARCVYKGDPFVVTLGCHEDITHVWKGAGEDSDIIAAYAVATFSNGTQQWEVLSREEIDKIRNQSPAGKDGPWVTHYSEMARKTAIRRLCKTLPLSAELVRAAYLDEQADAGIAQDLEFQVLPDEDVDIDTGEITPKPTKSSLDKLVEQKRMVKPPPARKQEPDPLVAVLKVADQLGFDPKDVKDVADQTNIPWKGMTNEQAGNLIDYMDQAYKEVQAEKSRKQEEVTEVETPAGFVVGDGSSTEEQEEMPF